MSPKLAPIVETPMQERNQYSTGKEAGLPV